MVRRPLPGSVIVGSSYDDVPTVQAVPAAVGDDGAIIDLAILGVPTERKTVSATVDTDDLEVGYRHRAHDSLTFIMIVMRRLQANTDRAAPDTAAPTGAEPVCG